MVSMRLIGYSRVRLSNQRQGFELHDQCHVFEAKFEKQMDKPELVVEREDGELKVIHHTDVGRSDISVWTSGLQRRGTGLDSKRSTSPK